MNNYDDFNARLSAKNAIDGLSKKLRQQVIIPVEFNQKECAPINEDVARACCEKASRQISYIVTKEKGRGKASQVDVDNLNAILSAWFNTGSKQQLPKEAATSLAIGDTDPTCTYAIDVLNKFVVGTLHSLTKYNHGNVPDADARKDPSYDLYATMLMAVDALKMVVDKSSETAVSCARKIINLVFKIKEQALKHTATNEAEIASEISELRDTIVTLKNSPYTKSSDTKKALSEDALFSRAASDIKDEYDCAIVVREKAEALAEYAHELGDEIYGETKLPDYLNKMAARVEAQKEKVTKCYTAAKANPNDASLKMAAAREYDKYKELSEEYQYSLSENEAAGSRRRDIDAIILDMINPIVRTYENGMFDLAYSVMYELLKDVDLLSVKDAVKNYVLNKGETETDKALKQFSAMIKLINGKIDELHKQRMAQRVTRREEMEKSRSERMSQIGQSLDEKMAQMDAEFGSLQFEPTVSEQPEVVVEPEPEVLPVTDEDQRVLEASNLAQQAFNNLLKH